MGLGPCRQIMHRSGKRRKRIRKVTSIVTGGVVAVLGIYLLWLASTPARITSTHHAQIRIELLDTAGPPEAKLAECDQIIRVLDTWAGKVNFCRVPPDQTRSMHLSWSTSNANGNERVTYFREIEPGDPSWPLEVMVAFDPSSPAVEISMAEGYHKQPSQRLQDAYRTLLDHLREHYGSKILSSNIW